MSVKGRLFKRKHRSGSSSAFAGANYDDEARRTTSGIGLNAMYCQYLCLKGALRFPGAARIASGCARK